MSSAGRAGRSAGSANGGLSSGRGTGAKTARTHKASPARSTEQPGVSRSGRVRGDAVDPMGRAALFWMPVEDDRVAPSPGSVRTSRPVGKEALFSASSGKDPSSREGLGQEAVLLSRYAFRASRFAFGALKYSAKSLCSFLGSLDARIECSSCGAETVVSPGSFFALQLPVCLWVPRLWTNRRKPPSHFMVCPACRRRSWTTVSWRLPRLEQEQPDAPGNHDVEDS